MAIMNFALLALVPFVLARPQVGHGDSHKALHLPRQVGTGLPGPFSRGTSSEIAKASGTAPFPVPGGNGTSGAATGSSGAPLSTGNGGPVYITSVISVIPTPITSLITDSAAASGATGGSGGSGSGSQQTGGAGGNGAGSACGPATVTITNKNTVTVTVTPAGGAGQSSAVTAGGASSQAGAVSSSVAIPPVSSAPFPIGNSTAPAGTGTGTAVSGALTSSVAAVQATSSSAAPSSVAAVQATSSSVASSSVAAVQATSSSVPAAQPYQPAAEKYKPQQSQGPPPAPPSSSPVVAPPASSPSAPPPPPASSSVQVASVIASSSAPAASSSAPSSPSTVGAKGLSYNTAQQVNSVSGLAWACNWGQTAAVPNPSFEYVPQLWGKKPGMADSIKANCAGKPACIFYNEPDKSLDVGGSGVDITTAISDFTSIMKPIQAAGSKVSTPCVANSDSDYMQQFVSAFPKGSIDIMCFHWYGNDLSGLKGTVSTFQALASQYGIKEMWMNEWAVQPTPSDLSSYTTYLDGAVTRYAYNANDLAGASY